MDIADIITNPQYIPIFGIWASGYLAVYSLFSDSNKWREWDTTIKLLYSIIMSLCIEACIILPLFYLNINNINLNLTEVLNRTWVYAFALSGFLTFTLRIVHNKNMILNIIKFITYNLLFYFYSIGMILTAIAHYEFNYFYSPYIIAANQKIIIYIKLNMLFFIMGLGFVFYFNMILDGLYFNTPGYKKYIRNDAVKTIKNLLLNIYLIKLELKNTLDNMTAIKKLFSILFIPLVIVLIMPVDSAYHILTPKITGYNDVILTSEKEIYLLIESNFSSFNMPPLIKTYFLYKNKDVYEIHSGKYDRINVIHTPLPKNKEVDLNYCQGQLNNKYSLLCVDVDLEYEDRIKLEVINNKNNLRVNYKDLSNTEFNVSLLYWDNMNIKNILITPKSLQIVEYNETHDTWIQMFEIINESPINIMIGEITYDRFNFGNVDKDSLQGYWNNQTLSHIWYDNNGIKLLPLEVRSGTESIVGFSYNVRERYLEN